MKVNFNRVGAGAFALLLSAGFLVSGGCASSKVLEQRPYIPAPGETDSTMAVEPTAPDAQIKNAQVKVEATKQPNDVATPIIPDNPSTAVSPAPTGPVNIGKVQPSNPSLQPVYTVQKGDSLWKIGHKFGMSASELASYNNIPETKALVVGQTIRVPASARSTGKGHVLATVAPEVTTSAALPALPSTKAGVAAAAAPEAAPVKADAGTTVYPPFNPKKTTPIYSHTAKGEKAEKSEKKSDKKTTAAKKVGAKAEKSAKTEKSEAGEAAEKTEKSEKTEEVSADKAGKANEYTVQKGDTWAKIAKKHKIHAVDLAAANNKKVADKLHVGQKLTIPEKGAAKDAKTAKTGKDAKSAKEETDSLIGDVSVDTAAPEKAEAPAKGAKAGKDAKTAKTGKDAKKTPAKTEEGAEAAAPAKADAAAPKADKADKGGVDLDAEAVKTRNIEVTEDSTIEAFAAKAGVKPEEVRKHNPEIGAEGKLKKGDIITIPE